MPDSPTALRCLPAFECGHFDPNVAAAMRRCMEQTQKYGKKTLKDVIEIGNDFVVIESALTRTEFKAWMRARIRGTRPTVTNYMNVARWLSGHLKIIFTLNIQPTAALKLAAPCVPEEARLEALRLAQVGVAITTADADELIAAARAKLGLDLTAVLAARLRRRLVNIAEQCTKRWPSIEFRYHSRKLLTFARSPATSPANHNGRKQ